MYKNSQLSALTASFRQLQSSSLSDPTHVGTQAPQPLPSDDEKEVEPARAVSTATAKNIRLAVCYKHPNYPSGLVS